MFNRTLYFFSKLLLFSLYIYFMLSFLSLLSWLYYLRDWHFYPLSLSLSHMIIFFSLTWSLFFIFLQSLFCDFIYGAALTWSSTQCVLGQLETPWSASCRLLTLPPFTPYPLTLRCFPLPLLLCPYSSPFTPPSLLSFHLPPLTPLLLFFSSPLIPHPSLPLLLSPHSSPLTLTHFPSFLYSQSSSLLLSSSSTRTSIFATLEY